jgi:deferrochelatase/peroxidase EfeB
MSGSDASTAAGSPGLSRRRMIGLLAGGVVVGAGAGSGVAVAATSSSPKPTDSRLVPFFGAHQAGIATTAQDRLHFAAFDLSTTSLDELISLLKAWTNAASQLTAGNDIGTGAVSGAPSSPPDDTGEAFGLAASRLTLTFGFGTDLFSKAGKDRFGLARKRPVQLAEMPGFPGDALDPARSGGDLCVQACADDPQVAVHAIRNLARIARGTASIRYSQLGFGRTSSTSVNQSTPRNMMGFKDGTANIKSEDSAELDKHVWVQRGDGPGWMVGGSPAR